jgi:glyoxylase-like metal-dependent hydrolase (beta-lactamase superfamily II)
VILASDAIFTLENFGPPARPAGYPLSPANAARTVEKIRARAECLEAQVWCGHDMKQFTNLRHSTEGWYE